MSPDFGMKFFFFNDTATTEIYTLSLHDALPILRTGFSRGILRSRSRRLLRLCGRPEERAGCQDRKSTRLNSSHSQISYAVFCLKKKKLLKTKLSLLPNKHFRIRTIPNSWMTMLT